MLDMLNLQLEPHPTARSRAVAKPRLRPGSTIIAIPSFCTVLLPSEKGHRCDACHRLSSTGRALRRCTGCASYWYCDNECQTIQWRSHHKRICGLFNRYTSSDEYQALAPHERLDSLLLSHLVAQITPTISQAQDESSPLAILLSLLPGPVSWDVVPSLCYRSSLISEEMLRSLYSRFGNNNFAVHSHLNTFGHGIFPLASRLFNHSCVPNAAAKYVLSPNQPVTMEVIALREILPGEEICLPYLDPALLQSRHQIFELTYGFRCTCSSCQFLGKSGRIPPPPEDLDEVSGLGHMLRDFVGINHPLGPALPNKNQEHIPSSLLCVFHESYLSTISESFSKSSHEGAFDRALEVGMTLLALYVLIYPPNYPQIGMHLLELAKTSWNAVVSSKGMSGETEENLLEQVRSLLVLGRGVLMILGPEGDEDGPLLEIETLQSLLDQ